VFLSGQASDFAAGSLRNTGIITSDNLDFHVFRQSPLMTDGASSWMGSVVANIAARAKVELYIQEVSDMTARRIMLFPCFFH